jgi:uncharacterized protein YjbJ (UPF0337 family)
MGVTEQLKGKAKQVAGDLVDDENLHAEGEAQEDKGIEERKEMEARAKAKLHEEKADLAERKQEAAETD